MQKKTDKEILAIEIEICYDRKNALSDESERQWIQTDPL